MSDVAFRLHQSRILSLTSIRTALIRLARQTLCIPAPVFKGVREDQKTEEELVAMVFPVTHFDIELTISIAHCIRAGCFSTLQRWSRFQRLVRGKLITCRKPEIRIFKYPYQHGSHYTKTADHRWRLTNQQQISNAGQESRRRTAILKLSLFSDWLDAAEICCARFKITSSSNER